LALLTLGFDAVAPRLRLRQGLLAAAVLMAGTGLFGVFQDFWRLLPVAFVGTINPSGGDVSVLVASPAPVRRMLGIPSDLLSCHAAAVDG
jgi:hypothetical protein